MKLNTTFILSMFVDSLPFNDYSIQKQKKELLVHTPQLSQLTHILSTSESQFNCPNGVTVVSTVSPSLSPLLNYFP